MRILTIMLDREEHVIRALRFHSHWCSKNRTITLHNPVSNFVFEIKFSNLIQKNTPSGKKNKL